jgi:pyruvate/2-oxoglutarate dehydrogenase complex dihydrolipoamide acyltransferase (E2) component
VEKTALTSTSERVPPPAGAGVPTSGRPSGVARIPALRVAQRDVLTFLDRPRTIHALVEADVTDTRARIQAARQRGTDVSFTAFVIACLAKTVAEHWSVQAYTVRGRTVWVPRYVDVNTQVERIMDGQPMDVPVIIRDAETKSVRAITAEIRAAQRDEDPATYPRRTLRWYSRIPRPVRALAWIGLRRHPRLATRAGGTVAVTSVGMFGHHPGWGVPVSAGPLVVTVAGITTQPRVVGGAVLPREVLALTVSFDHDVVDGAPAARFVSGFLTRIERGDALPADPPAR